MAKGQGMSIVNRFDGYLNKIICRKVKEGLDNDKT